MDSEQKTVSVVPFEEIADHYTVKQRLVVFAGTFGSNGGSSLTDKDIAVTPANLSGPGIPTSYVPFRNAHLLSVAASWAEVVGGRYIYIGARRRRSSGYPDCRPEFYDAFQRAINLGTKPETHIEIRTPVIAMRKSEIVELGQRLNAPFELTWSVLHTVGGGLRRLRFLRSPSPGLSLRGCERSNSISA